MTRWDGLSFCLEVLVSIFILPHFILLYFRYEEFLPDENKLIRKESFLCDMFILVCSPFFQMLNKPMIQI